MNIKKFKYLTIFSLFLIGTSSLFAQSFKQTPFNQCNNYSSSVSFTYSGQESQKLFRRAMELCYKEFFSFYDPKTKTPLWVIEKITNQSNGYLKREDNFSPDPNVPYSAQAKLSDYKGSGFDRGHMAAAANMTSSESMRESFYLTNMVPQVGPNMNRGIWADLEETARAFASKNPEVYVISGPIFNNKKVTIGKNEVYVPSELFKILYIPRTKEIKYYIMPNVQIVTRKTKSLDDGNPVYEQTQSKSAINCSSICNSESFRVNESKFIEKSSWKFNFK